jgi:hypothetical protein
MELILESDSDAHSSYFSAQNDNDSGDTTYTIFTQWTDCTNCWPVVHKFTGGPSG